MGENRRRRKPANGRLSRQRRRSKADNSSARGADRKAGVVHLPPRPRSGRRKPGARRAPAKAVGRRRVRIVAVAVAVFGLLLGGRAAHLSFVDAERFEVLAAGQSTQLAQSSIGERGDIVSADGRKLATSLTTAKVVATPYLIHSPEKAARRLATTLGSSSPDEIEAALTRRDGNGDLTGYSVIASQVDPDVAERVRDLEIEGITALPAAQRVYPEDELASQLTGYLGDYGRAFGGVEARYAKTLQSGKDVHLTVDTAVQQQLEEALTSAAGEYKAKNALGLVMRVEDGEIVALANTPTYDNNHFAQASPEAQRNRAITDVYEPGSTFKAITMSAALEENAVSPRTEFTVPDHILVADRMIYDSLPHPTRVMTPPTILQESSNVGTIKVAEKLGGERLAEYIERFGIGQPTGIDLWGEASGSMPAYEDWSGSSIGNIPMGQGVSVTPLQLATAYATIANGGVEVTPNISGRTDSAQPGPRVISEETSSIVKGMLQNVVEKGTGRYARIPGYSVAGKTGTSQKVDPETGTYGDEYVASFIGFAPVSDPEYLTLIVVDEPQGLIWGESVAAPAFQKVMRFTLGYYNVPPDLPLREESGESGSRQKGAS